MIPSAKIKVAIADDHHIVIEGLSAALKNFTQIDIVATATSGASMMNILRTTKTDLLITDVMMPGMDGHELSQTVRAAFPEIRIIALSMNGNGDQVEKMVPYIDAYLLKQSRISELVQAIETVYNGGTFFDASVQMERLRHRRSMQNIKDIGITPREKQIIQLLEKDFSNKDISSQLCISIRTVETHRKNILRKTGTTNVLTLIKWAYEQKLL
jgi:two-component system nitrate/nitrite response regulator NarL